MVVPIHLYYGEGSANSKLQQSSLHLQAWRNEYAAEPTWLKSISFCSTLCFPADLGINAALYSRIDWLSWRRRSTNTERSLRPPPPPESGWNGPLRKNQVRLTLRGRLLSSPLYF